MRSERGQASVEWIVLVLLLAAGLAALGRFAPRADAGHLGTELVSHLTCAARGCDGERGVRPRGGERTPRGTRGRLVTVPPLVAVTPRNRRATRPDARPSLRPPRSAGPLILRAGRRAGRRAGALWRRAWVLCLGYERVRYSVLHPEIRFPHQTIPVSEDLRIANDCLSPVDLVRDFGRRQKP
jgi:hypothetical protein